MMDYQETKWIKWVMEIAQQEYNGSMRLVREQIRDEEILQLTRQKEWSVE